MPSLMSPRDRRYSLFETPPHYTDALVDVIGTDLHSVYDCCSGQRAILNQLRRRGCSAQFHTNDLDRRQPALHHYNAARDSPAWGTLGIRWCITNPPFKHELAILSHALFWHKNVAFLARLSFLEPTLDRREFWSGYADTCRVIVLPRYSFRKNSQGKRQSDTMTCCWLVWSEDLVPLEPASSFAGLSVSSHYEPSRKKKRKKE